MDLEIASIHKQGNAAEEYVVLRVLADCNTRFYAIADTSYVDPTHISNRLRHFFWFPDQEVKKGDILFLNTGIGKDKTQTRQGTTFHWFHWGLRSAVWNNTGDAAVLFDMAAWSTTKAR